jgi:sugar transferase (PEP-CTERM/EpsH1 system associated)
MALHVAHLVTSFDMGGLQNGIVNLVNHSDPGRVRHTVLSFRHRTGLSDRLRRGDVRSLDLPEGRVPFAYRIVAEALSAIRPDVVHTRNWGTYPDGILAARRAGVRRRVHGYHGRDLANASGERLRRRVMGRLLSWATDRIVTLTPTMKAEYLRDFGVSADRVEVVPNGIDIERLAAFAADPELASPFTVATVGRLDPVKNLPLLVRAFARMANRGPDDLLVVAGDGPERERVADVARTEGVADRLRLLGERKDAPAVMKAAAVYVQPSFYEGMSNTVVEAMACGVAVVATDVGGNADVAGRDGTARIVPSDDVDALRRTLEALRDDPEARRRTAEAGRARVVERFGLPRMVESYTRLYEDVVGRDSVGTLVGEMG